MTFEEAALLPRSEKVTLVTIEAVAQYKVFDLHSGSVYVKQMEHFVSGVKQDGVSLTQSSVVPLSSGKFYYDIKSKLLYVWMTGSGDPKESQLSCTHRFFYSNAPINLPHDLNNGEIVEFAAKIPDGGIGSLGQQLDDENTGICMESSSSIKLINEDGFFDEVFDTLIWENQSVLFYSWFPTTPITEVKKIFEGVIESKDFSTSEISFKVKDFVFRLKNQVNLPLFSNLDGTLAPSILGTPKRRIYGQVKQLPCAGIDSVLSGISLTGLLTLTAGSATITGTGTAFLSELTPGDEIFIQTATGTYKVGIDSVSSDTSLVISKESDGSFVNVSATYSPSIPLRSKNRKWHIAGHKLRAPSSEIDFVYSSNRVRVLDSSDLYAGDSVKINNEYVTIRRISGRQIVLNNALSPKPVAGDLLEKNPVSKVFFGSKEMVIDRDWTLVNNTNDSYIEFNALAEFNIVEPKSVGVSLVFTNASRTITTSATIDLRTILKPRDWIRKNSITETAYYEILDVKEQSITLRTAFAGTTQTTTGLMKNVTLIDDDSLITVNCIGLEVSGSWIKTPAQAVRHLVLNDAGFASVNEESFSKASFECDYILSMFIPDKIGSKSPLIKDVITKINESVFGSLYGDSSWAISYSILNSKKPELLQSLKDDDIISFDVTSDQKIINSVKINYRPFTDIFSGQDAFEVYQKTSTFVDSLIGIANSEERTIYLYEDDKALIIGQRILLFRSLSNCKVKVRAKMNLAMTSVNDKIYLELDRMYRRYGGKDKRKIGVVTSIKKNGFDVDVDFIDLGGIYNRVPSIAPNTANNYATASRDEVIQYGYFVDNQTLTPDVLSELELGNNLIG